MFGRKKSQPSHTRGEIIDEWLSFYPVRQMDYEKGENDLVTVIVPHPESWLTRTFLPKPKNPAQKIRLDEIGSYVWLLFDGSHSIETVCHKLNQKFGGKIELARERTVVFAQQLYRNSYIRVYRKGDPGIEEHSDTHTPE